MTSAKADVSAKGISLEALRDEFERAYPGTKVSNSFLFEARLALKLIRECEGCTGEKCKKSGNKCSVGKAAVRFGELTLVNIPCKYAERIRRGAVIANRFGESQIPARYLGKTLSDYEITAGNENAVKWAKNKVPSLYLYGSPGVGKTLLAAIMAQERLKRGESVIYGDVPSLLDKLKGTFDKKSESRLEELMATLGECGTLVLDDLGTEKPTEWALERLYVIINNRYNAGRGLIVTSNYNPDDLLERFGADITGQRIVSRLREMCKVTRIEGVDRRLRRQ